MYRIFEFDVNLFSFKPIIENILQCEVEKLHKKYQFDNQLCDFTGGNINNDIKRNDEKINVFDFTEKIYPQILNNPLFNKTWNQFSNYIKYFIFNGDKIYIQKTPSIRIFPSESKLQYVKTTSKIFDRESNWHIDNDEPFWHPSFEKNMWMSLIKTDNDNSLYIEDNKTIKPLLMNNGQLLMFDSVYHGAFVHNRSINTRMTMDFKVFPVSHYDTNLLTDKIIKKRGKYFKQSEWYSEKFYYRII